MRFVTTKAKIHQSFNHFLLLGIAFSIPIENFVYSLTVGLHSRFPNFPEIRLTSTLIAFLVLNWLLEAKYIKTFPLIFKERSRFLIFTFSFLYLFYVAGLIYTTNFHYARLDLGIKFTMLLFPLIFATSDESDYRRELPGMIIKGFAIGCIAISFILYGHALYYSFVNHSKDAFYYSNLSWFFHPAYLAMYMTFVISNILCHLLIKQSVNGFRKIAFHILLLAYFSVFIILLSSKAGLIALLAVILGYAVLLGFRFRRWLKAFTFMAVSLMVLFAGVKIFPFMTERISQAGKDLQEQDSMQNSGKSTSDRIGIWRSSINIILTHPFIGVGTGDVKDELLKEYKKNNILPALEQKLNAHNQYLQTFVSTGTPGFLILVLMILIPALYSVKQEQYLYFFFLVIFGINILVESMLEIQQGVIFYSFFNIVFFFFRRP